MNRNVEGFKRLGDAIKGALISVEQFNSAFKPTEGELYIVGYNTRHERVYYGSRVSSNVHGDSTLIYKALEFRDAAKRDGRIFICDLVPRWKRPFLRMLGIRF